MVPSGRVLSCPACPVCQGPWVQTPSNTQPLISGINRKKLSGSPIRKEREKPGSNIRLCVLGRQSQGFLKFKASKVYAVSARPARVKQQACLEKEAGETTPQVLHINIKKDPSSFNHKGLPPTPHSYHERVLWHKVLEGSLTLLMESARIYPI